MQIFFKNHPPSSNGLTNPSTWTLTCPAHGGSSRMIWIQPCCDSSCPAGRGFLWEKKSPGQSGPLWTCSRHTRVASKPGNTQIAPAGCPYFWCTCNTAKTQPWMMVKESWKQKQMKRNRTCSSTLKNTLWKQSQHTQGKPGKKENTHIRIESNNRNLPPLCCPVSYGLVHVNFLFFHDKGMTKAKFDQTPSGQSNQQSVIL